MTFQLPALHQSFVSLRGTRFSLFSTEDRGRPVLYCLHGGPGIDHQSLLPGILRLSEIFDLVLIDQRGDGQTGRPSDEDYSLRAYASDLDQLRRQLHAGKRPAGVFGHSFGGSIALETLSAYPAAFDFGVLCNTPLTPAWMSAMENEIKRLADPEISRAHAAWLADPESDLLFQVSMLAAARLYFSELPPVQAREIMSRWGYRAYPFRMASRDTYTAMDLRPSCARVTAPCLVVGSSHDPIVPWSQIEEAGGRLPGVTMACIQGAGHFPFITQGDEFFRQVSQWWEVTRKGVQA